MLVIIPSTALVAANASRTDGCSRALLRILHGVKCLQVFSKIALSLQSTGNGQYDTGMSRPSDTR